MPEPSDVAFDVVVLGAGPAGTACALALRGSGLRVALVDKARFPRDKICGDAIPGPALKALRQLDPAYADELLAGLHPKAETRTSRVVAPNGRGLAVRWHLPTFNSPRLHFDAALLALVKRHTATEIREGFAVKTLAPAPDGLTLTAPDGRRLHARLLIACDGAHSVAARQLAHRRLDRAHHCAAVRAYYTGMADADGRTTEFFFLKKYPAGYLWVFPVGAGVHNVGFGMLSSDIAKQGVDLKKTLLELLATHPQLAGRFAQARALGPLAGFGLPLGTGRPAHALAGAHWLLCGDAASLIDPLQGHGIDTAVKSGILAAAQAVACFAQQDFSTGFMQQYARAVQARLGPQLARSYRIMRFLGNKPWLVNAGVRLAQVPLARRWLQRLVG
ncbi:geranylgeranyl reductase family protein [Hymenobacter caeli]|uniref:Geranylgeranyl reductase family protein n=1 Tax=Hymenobacter caeli TaxID=2735894 RepID=A0ABX2FV98_9BACT|nr:geranylgeranyl reductase family protein [Hymenobacter caeli]NRT20394.1 geranylgeranyl reductase family protein [Hymenobacter caeli]